MGQLSAYVTAPYQGISQAPPQARLPASAEALEDGIVQVPEGWSKRPPIEWLTQLVNHGGNPEGTFERIVRGTGIDWVVTIVRDLMGNVVPRVYPQFPSALPTGTYTNPLPIVVDSDAQAYLNTGFPTPDSDIVALTVEDFTFLLNKQVVVANQAGTAPARPHESIVWCKQGAYARTYTILVTPSTGTPVQATLHTPNGTSASDGDWITTEAIMNQLVFGSGYTTVNGASSTGSLGTALTTQGFTIQGYGAVVYISHPTIDFTITVVDGQGGTILVAVKDVVQDFASLPVRAAPGFTVRITQNSASPEDDFFVQYQAKAGPNSGIWQEVIGPGAQLGVNPATLPVGLVLDPSGSFIRVKVLPWKPRSVGNETLIPDPEFVGQQLQDVSYWRGRLALISKEGVMLCASDDPFRIYPKTLATKVDSDPIALLSPFPSKSDFQHAVTFDKQLIIFGDIYQAAVSAEGPPTTDNTRIDTLTTFQASGLARPQGANGKVYFVAPRGSNWGTVYELSPNQVTNVTEGEDMTVSVPRYVPSQVDRVAVSPVNYLIAYGVSGQSQIIVHLFRYAEKQRVQNGWMRWNLPKGYALGGMFFDGSYLYLALCHGDTATTHFGRINVSPDQLDSDETGVSTILTYLDLKIAKEDTVHSYDSVADETTINLPWTPTEDTRCTVFTNNGIGGIVIGDQQPTVYEGQLIPIKRMDASTAVLAGEWSRTALYFGQNYRSYWTLSRLYAVGQDGQPIRSGRFSIRRIVADLDTAAYVKAEVVARGRPLRTYTFSGYTAGDPDSVVGVPSTGPAKFSFPVMAENEQATITFVNDSHLPCKVLGFEWRGELNTKAQRVT